MSSGNGMASGVYPASTVVLNSQSQGSQPLYYRKKRDVDGYPIPYEMEMDPEYMDYVMNGDPSFDLVMIPGNGMGGMSASMGGMDGSMGGGLAVATGPTGSMTNYDLAMVPASSMGGGLAVAMGLNGAMPFVQQPVINPSGGVSAGGFAASSSAANAPVETTTGAANQG